MARRLKNLPAVNWEQKASKATVSLADDLLAIVKQFGPVLTLKYNKFYIGLARDGQAYNFVTFRPRKGHMLLGLKLPESEDINQKIEKAGIDMLEYDKRWTTYRLQLSKADVSNKAEVLKDLMQLAHDHRST